MDYRLATVVLVTGGAGFIGSHVVDELCGGGADVRIVDALLPAAHRERPDYLDRRPEFVEGDLRDPAVAEAVKSPETAKRLSAEGSTPVGSTPDAFQAHIRSEVAKWRKLVKEAGLALH